MSDITLSDVIKHYDKWMNPLSNAIIDMADYLNDYASKHEKTYVIFPVTGALILRKHINYIFKKKGYAHLPERYDSIISTTKNTKTYHQCINALCSYPTIDFSSVLKFNSLIAVDEMGNGTCCSKVFNSYYSNYMNDIFNNGFDNILFLAVADPRGVQIGLETNLDNFPRSSFFYLHKFECGIVNHFGNFIRNASSPFSIVPYTPNIRHLSNLSKNINSVQDYENNLKNILVYFARHASILDKEGFEKELEKLIGYDELGLFDFSLSKKIDILLGNNNELIKQCEVFNEYENIDNININLEKNKELFKVKKTNKTFEIKYFQSYVSFRDNDEFIGVTKKIIGEHKNDFTNTPYFVCEEIYPETSDKYNLLLQLFIDKNLGNIDRNYYEKILEEKFDDYAFEWQIEMFLDRFGA